jgi:hypothetical protein
MHFNVFLFRIIWLACGAITFVVTYKTKGDEYYITKGIYEAINVGYGLYLTTPEFGENGYIFTIFHLMIGSVMISGAMAEFASYLNKVNDTDNLKAIHVVQKMDDIDPNKVHAEEALMSGTENSCDRGAGRAAPRPSVSGLPSWCDREHFISMLLRWWKNYPFHVLFSSWLLLMTTSTSFQHNWTFFDSLCFSTSVLSTGGFISLPANASTFDHFVVALFAFVGVPLMALSLGMFTHYISRLGEQSSLVELINAGISSEELAEMEDLEILDDDGHFDISEYLILILLRIGALKPDLIKLTNIRFDQLQELQQNSAPSHMVSVHTFRRETVMNHKAEQQKFVKQASSLLLA